MSLERKIRGSVRSENIFKESVRKEDLIRLNWTANWKWYVDLLREREQVIENYKKSSPKALAMGALEKQDVRSVLPFPVTSAKSYGWLATKPEFELEGNCRSKYDWYCGQMRSLGDRLIRTMKTRNFKVQQANSVKKHENPEGKSISKRKNKHETSKNPMAEAVHATQTENEANLQE